jgi:hypothetical protein
MTILQIKEKENVAITLLKRYGKLIVKKHNQKEKRKMLKSIKNIAIQLNNI